MKHPAKRGLRDLCAHASDDDGIDPRREKKGHDHASAGRKDLSLCKQARRALDLELASWTWAIDVGLAIERVEPAPTATCLRVLVSWTERSLGRTEALARLGERGPSLRAAVAAAITRKRTPRLEFEAAPPGDDFLESGVADEA